MRKIFHVAVNTVRFKKSQRKWDFLLQLSVSLWIVLFAYTYLSNCLNSHGCFSRGGILTVCRANFHEPSFTFSGLFTFNCPHIVLTKLFPLWTEEMPNYKIPTRLMTPKIPVYAQGRGLRWQCLNVIMGSQTAVWCLRAVCHGTAC